MRAAERRLQRSDPPSGSSGRNEVAHQRPR